MLVCVCVYVRIVCIYVSVCVCVCMCTLSFSATSEALPVIRAHFFFPVNDFLPESLLRFLGMAVDSERKPLISSKHILSKNCKVSVVLGRTWNCSSVFQRLGSVGILSPVDSFSVFQSERRGGRLKRLNTSDVFFVWA
jgi:hypothetical protein